MILIYMIYFLDHSEEKLYVLYEKELTHNSYIQK